MTYVHDINELSVFCPRYQRAIELVGSRWTGAVLRALVCEVTRFSDLRGVIPGLSDRMLSERLKELEAEGLIARNVQATTPVKVEYRLTPMGAALEPVLDTIGHWATSWLELPDTAADSARAGC